MEIAKIVKPFIRRGWPNTFGNIVYHQHENAFIIYPDIVAKWLFLCKKHILPMYMFIFNIWQLFMVICSKSFKMILNDISVCSSQNVKFF